MKSDEFAKNECTQFYADRMGVADSLALRKFLQSGLDEAMPESFDHFADAPLDWMWRRAPEGVGIVG